MLLPGPLEGRTVLRMIGALIVSLFVAPAIGGGEPSSPFEREEKWHGLDEEADHQPLELGCSPVFQSPRTRHERSTRPSGLDGPRT
jgi:hypothetical protein